MQQVKSGPRKIRSFRKKRGRPLKSEAVFKKVPMYNRFDEPCRKYIRARARKLDISEVQFIQNCVGLMGKSMAVGFKFKFGNGAGRRAEELKP